jgi:hypothetical protein
MTSVTRDAPGDFGFQTLCGTYSFDARQIADPKPLFGLIRDGQYIYGGLRDDDGVLYCLLRKVEQNRFSMSFALQSDVDGKAMRIDRSVTPKAFFGPVEVEVDGDAVRFSPHRFENEISRKLISPPPATRFALEMAPGGMTWEEKDIANVTGSQIGPVVQWYTPYHGGGALYTSTFYKAEGSIGGKKVRGFVFFDQFYLPPGIAWTRDPFVLDLLLRWHTFGNYYDDGTVECGHFGFGHENWGYALVNDSVRGSVLATSDLESRTTERDEHGYFPKTIKTKVGGENWTWRADPSGHMIDLARTLNPNSAGLEKRDNEKRRILMHMSWGDSSPTHGDVREGMATMP